MFDSPWEWLIVGVVVLILFGSSKKIPELARSLGRASGEFKKGQTDIQTEIKKSMAEPTPSAADPETEKVFTLAQSMGVETAGKNTAEVKNELAEKLKSGN
jgi:twin arginine-targeting protein translocase, TatA/E family